MKNYNIVYGTYILVISAVFGLMLANQTSVSRLGMYGLLFVALVPIVIDALKDLYNKKITTELFLIFATGVALAAHEEQAITVVLIIMHLAKYAEEFIKEKTGRAIESLIRLVPTKVTAVIDGHEQVLEVGNVQPKMRLIIKTGEQIPVDGIIVDGQASINESFLTGESTSLEKGIKDPVFAGTFVQAGSVVVVVHKIGSETHFGKISRLLEQAEKEKAAIVSVTNRAALVVVQLMMVFIGIVWFVTGNLSLVATLLVFGSPIELTLITPLAILAATAAAFRSGILIKGGSALEHFSDVDILIFDKTGTLTIGQPEVVSIESLNQSYAHDDILTIAAMMEKRSGHVLAKAILQRANENKREIPDPDRYESVTGHGIEVEYDGKKYLLGSQHFIEAPEHANIHISESLRATQDSSSTFFYLACDNQLCGRIGVADSIRPEAKNTIDQLKKFGIKKVMLLSGDRLEVAQHVAAQLGIETVFGQVDPDEKLRIIKDLQQKGHKVAMIGDGINDAPALVQADVGIAMGAMGMEPAIQAADIVLMANNVQGVVFVYALSRKVFRLILQNIFVGLAAVHIFGIVLALFNVVTPIEAALFHAVTDLFILVNSARLIRFKLD
ncbi:cation-translocating P-type ATPase [Candidatus Babeliales bacterium]|nr:cation-translocating P-type ATPase [Candidatus Babeliales bacterium]